MYFDRALRVAKGSDPLHQPTLQAIRAQILIWWAMSTAKSDSKTTAEKVSQAMSIIRPIGQTDGLQPMLVLENGRAVSGWFAEGWNALASVDWDIDFDRDCCQTFLSCFTFNYH